MYCTRNYCIKCQLISIRSILNDTNLCRNESIHIICFGSIFKLSADRVLSSFSSLVQSLLPKDTLLRTYLTSLQLVTGPVWRR